MHPKCCPSLALALVLGLSLPAVAFEPDEPSLFDDEDALVPGWPEGAAFAQRGERGHGRGRLSPEQRAQLEQEVQRKMHTFVTVELSSRLGLDDKTALRLADVVRSHGEKQRAARAKLREEYKVLEQLLATKAGADALKKQTQVVLAAMSARPDLEDLAAETAKFLTVEQQAKLVIAAPQVMREMGRMMRQARKGPRGGPGGPGEGLAD